MKSLTVRLDALQPIVAARSSKVAYFQQSHDHVPGATLRGALAGAWIAEYGTPQDSGREHAADFAALFEGDISYGPAAQGALLPKPLSLVECKNRLDGAACASRFHDLASDSSPAAIPVCECGSPTVASKGGYGINLIRRTRTAIDPSTQKAADGQLFSEEMLPPTRYCAQVFVPDHVDDRLIEWLCMRRRLRVGGNRSVLGAVDYSTAEILSEIQVPEPRGGRRVVRVMSDTILVDDAGRPSYDLGAWVLRYAAMVDSRLAAQLEVGDSWVRPVTITGWHVASGLPKPTDLAIAAGSTTVIMGPAEALALADGLALCGIGLRRREGYGRVVLDPEEWSRPAAEPAEESVAVAADPTELGEIYELVQGLYKASREPLDDIRKIRELAKSHAHIAVDVAEVLGRARWRDSSPKFRERLRELLQLLVDQSARRNRVTAIIRECDNILGIS